MKMKNLTAALLLGLSLSVPLTAFAEQTPAITIITTETTATEASSESVPETQAATEKPAESESETQAVTERTTETEPAVSPVTVKKSGKKYYLYNTLTGKKVRGLKGVREYPSGSGNYYYFANSKGRIYANKLIRTKKGKIYYAAKDGVLATGFTEVKGRTFYFKPSTHAAVTGWKKISGVYYRFSKKGYRLTGVRKIGKYTYYLDPAKNGAKSTGWIKVDGNWQYYSRKGRRQYGLLKDSATKTYYFTDTDGNRKTGLITYKGSIYYFDKDQGVRSDGTKIGGAMVTGWRTIQNKTYYFGASGKAVTGILKKDGKTYYFNQNGVMQTGTVTIGSTVYTFDKTTGALTNKETVSGPYSIKVNQGTGVVTIYRGNTPVKAMLCSVGLNGATPNGTFTLDRKIQWQPLFGNVYGQYTSRITGNILFHSVYYTRYKDNNSLATAEFNKLGSPASHGCVRLSCGDAYYIYTNCPNGTKVTIFRGTAKDDPLPRPARLVINTSYDPTDPITND